MLNQLNSFTDMKKNYIAPQTENVKLDPLMQEYLDVVGAASGGAQQQTAD